MIRAWYAGFFALAVLALSISGLLAFQRLELSASEAEAASAPQFPQRIATKRSKAFIPIAADPADYARYDAGDAAWRQRNARQYTVSELRVRGDGIRTAKDSLEDRVFEYTRRGKRALAITELERWVALHPGDERQLLALARLLNETGRSEAAIERYRQLLAAKHRNGTK